MCALLFFICFARKPYLIFENEKLKLKVDLSKYFSRMFSDDYDPSDIPPDQAGYSYPVPANPLELPSMEGDDCGNDDDMISLLTMI